MPFKELYDAAQQQLLCQNIQNFSIMVDDFTSQKIITKTNISAQFLGNERGGVGDREGISFKINLDRENLSDVLAELEKEVSV